MWSRPLASAASVPGRMREDADRPRRPSASAAIDDDDGAAARALRLEILHRAAAASPTMLAPASRIVVACGMSCSGNGSPRSSTERHRRRRSGPDDMQKRPL